MKTQDCRVIKPSGAQCQWHDMELGMFYHFDIPIYKPGWNWRSWKDYPDPNLYQPTKLDTDQWLEAAKAIGAKYAVFVAKHCSGFLQWQSDLYPYGVKQSSWRNGKGDVVEDFVNSCHKYGIKPGLYASVSANGFLGAENPGIINPANSTYPVSQDDYIRICEQMVTELWTRYGDMFEVWFDGGAIPVEAGGPNLIPILKKHQPNAIVFQGPIGTPNMIRWVGNERGVAPYPCWNTALGGTNEGGDIEGRFDGDPNGQLWIPGECDVPIRNHDWFWEEGHEDKLYSLDELMEMYYCSVGRNCNLLLNANPGPDGLVPEADMQRYVEFGCEIRKRFSTPLAATRDTGNVIELTLPEPQPVNHVIIMEDIREGERILKYSVEGLTSDGSWKQLCGGQSVGHKRIEQFETTAVSKLRLNALRTKDIEPIIRDFSTYNVSS